MSNYGIRRMAVLDTGGYSQAVLDLSRPVHLAAPNNGGKSSLVNALQFLYVDSIDKMHFAHHMVEETRRHYFASERSYIVFECLTPSGIRCMLVRGLGDIQAGEFERWVFDGEFSSSDFIDDDGIVASFEVVRKRFAGRNLLPVKGTHLWEVLSGTIPAKATAVPTLHILPVRTRDEYHAFRDAYVKLLSLADVNADALQRLIINCNAREIGEQRINVAIEYREQFERAERRDRELRLMEAIGIKVQEGREVRRAMGNLMSRLSADGLALAGEIRRAVAIAKRAIAGTDSRLAHLQAQLRELAPKKAERHEQLVDAQTDIKLAVGELAKLDKMHARFASYSPEFVHAKRENVRSFEERVAEQRSSIRDAARYDLAAMRRDLHAMAKQIQDDQVLLENWDDSVASTALRDGVTRDELANAFRLLNPHILKLPVGESVEVRDAAAVVGEVRGLAQSVKDERFETSAVTIDLKAVARPDMRELEDRETVRRQVELRQHTFAEKQRRLKVAEEVGKARNALEQLQRELEERSQEVRDYDIYVAAHSRRAQMEQCIANVQSRAKAIADEIRSLEGTEANIRDQVQDAGRVSGEVARSVATLTNEWHEWKSDAATVGVSITTPTDETASAGDDRFDDSSDGLRMVEASQRKLAHLGKQVREVHRLNNKLQEIETHIKRISQTLPGQQIYFSDRDADWEELGEKADAIDQLRTTVRQEWDSLFVTLSARFDGMASGLASIEKAIRRLNSGLRSYRVSNLKAVEIRFERNHETAFIVEALAGQNSVFRDLEREDEARQGLKRMIDCGQVIDLRSLFHLRIRVQGNDDNWQEAPSLDHIGSTGTGITAKAMIFVQLVRTVAADERFRLQFYLDETGQLDDANLHAVTEMAVRRAVMPITAEPSLRVAPVAHPEVTVYLLGSPTDGRIQIRKYNILRARRTEKNMPEAANG